MIITKKIIITDTNIITDLNSANLLDKFVRLDNVYISDLVLRDEVKSSTGDLSIIKKFKVMKVSAEEIIESIRILNNTSGMSHFDITNYVIARDNDGILATGDQKLKNYSEKNGVEVIRTLRIIRLMYDKHIITKEEVIASCKALKENIHTRIPEEYIDTLIKEMEKDSSE